MSKTCSAKVRATSISYAKMGLLAMEKEALNLKHLSTEQQMNIHMYVAKEES